MSHEIIEGNTFLFFSMVYWCLPARPVGTILQLQQQFYTTLCLYVFPLQTSCTSLYLVKGLIIKELRTLLTELSFGGNKIQNLQNSPFKRLEFVPVDIQINQFSKKPIEKSIISNSFMCDIFWYARFIASG